MDRYALFTDAVGGFVKNARLSSDEPDPDRARAELRAALERARDDILAETAAEERAYQEAEAAATQWSAPTGRAPWASRNRVVALVALAVAVLGVVLWRLTIPWWGALLFGAAGVGLAVGNEISSSRRWNASDRALWIEATSASESWSAVDQARARADTALEAWRGALVKQALPRFMRRWANERRQISYGTTLEVRDWSGLWQPGDDVHVETPATAELQRILDRLDGGAIGLHGPRGAGKTHLMRAFCEGTRKPDDDLAIVIAAPVGYAPNEFVLHVDSRLCQEVLRRLGERLGTGRELPPPAQRWFAGVRGTRPEPDGARLYNLGRRVAEHRRHLSHLMTVADEVAGKVGVRLAEASARSAVTFVEQPRTYPEIVESFRTLLGEVATALEARVIIGIDDLDRIDSAERARAFVHEIKAIFGVPGCFYLVSVSDEAMTDFDQGGRFRGTFDSAFDELVRVDRLNLGAAKDILAQRTAVMSEPFRFLCHCVAGGPARELVRIARLVAGLDLDRTEGEPPLRLSAVTRRVVTVEARRLCLAVQTRFAPHEHRPGMAAAMRCLDAVAREPVTPRRVAELIDAVLGTVGDPAELLDVARVTAARLYHLLTVVEVFTDDIERARLIAANQAPAGTSWVDELAWARQQALTSPLLAWQAVDRVRAESGLTVKTIDR